MVKKFKAEKGLNEVWTQLQPYRIHLLVTIQVGLAFRFRQKAKERAILAKQATIEFEK